MVQGNRIHHLPVLLEQILAWFQYRIALSQNSSLLSTGPGLCSVWMLTPGLEARRFNCMVKGHSMPAGLCVRKLSQTHLMFLKLYPYRHSTVPHQGPIFIGQTSVNYSTLEQTNSCLGKYISMQNNLPWDLDPAWTAASPHLFSQRTLGSTPWSVTKTD